MAKSRWICNKAKTCKRPICTHKQAHEENDSCCGVCAFEASGHCEIIFPIRKPKRTVTVKAWAILFDDGTPLEAHTNRHADRLCGMNVTPCTITYLKGDKCLKRS